MSLKELVAEQKKNTTSHTSGKNPAYYNRQRKLFIEEMCNHDNPIVRAAAFASKFVPTKMLSEAASTEVDTDALKAIIMSDRLPQKTLEDFAGSSTATAFDADKEVLDHIRARFGLAAPESEYELAAANTASVLE